MQPELPSLPEPLPAEAVFLPDDVPAPPPARRLPGPGLRESLGWVAGFCVVQIGASVVTMCGLALLYVLMHPAFGAEALGRDFDLSKLTHRVSEFIELNLPMILGLAGFATVLYGTLAVGFRLRREGGLRGLGLQLPSFGHLVLVMLAVFPLSLLCTELQSALFRVLPDAKGDMEELFSQLGKAPLPLLLWAIAVAPALGEELLFRGLIGRGLLARYGVVGGILVTSILFGVAHLNPAQSVGVIPLGIAMHFVYLTTRSFWAPVFLHLLNNGFAVLMLKYGDDLAPSNVMGGDSATPLPLLTTSAAMVTALGLLLWQTRVRFARLDGTMVNSLCPAGEYPPHELELMPIRQSPQPLLLACGAFNFAGFLAVLWQAAAA